MISETSKIWSKSGPVDLLIITKMLQTIQEQVWEHPGKCYLCQSVTQQKNEHFRTNVCPWFHVFRLFCFSLCVILSTYFKNIFVEMRIEK